MKQMTSTKTLLIKDSFGICFGICHREKFCMTCNWTLPPPPVLWHSWTRCVERTGALWQGTLLYMQPPCGKLGNQWAGSPGQWVLQLPCVFLYDQWKCTIKWYFMNKCHVYPNTSVVSYRICVTFLHIIKGRHITSAFPKNLWLSL